MKSSSIQYYVWDFWHDPKGMKFYLVYEIIYTNEGFSELIFLEKDILL